MLRINHITSAVAFKTKQNTFWDTLIQTFFVLDNEIEYFSGWCSPYFPCNKNTAYHLCEVSPKLDTFDAASFVGTEPFCLKPSSTQVMWMPAQESSRHDLLSCVCGQLAVRGGVVFILVPSSDHRSWTLRVGEGRLKTKVHPQKTEALKQGFTPKHRRLEARACPKTQTP